MSKETQSPQSSDITDLTARLSSLTPSLSTLTDDAARSRLLHAARQVVLELEKPEEKLISLAKAPVGHAVLRFAFNVSLFEKSGDGTTVTLNELATACGVERLLLIRMMRTLTCLEIFSEDEPGVYAHTALSKALVNPKVQAIIRGMSETATIMPHLPSYLASTHYRNPSDPENSFFGYANNTSQNMFEWLETRPEQLRIFTEYQSATAELSLYSLRPLLEEFLSKDVDEDGDGEGERPVLFVDVGGGRGTTLREVCRSLQPLKGRVVLQDLLKVVEGVEGAEADEVEVMAHDFLKKQPVKGAHTYFLRHILHNWPSTTCRTILHHLLSACSPHSRIIIVDPIMPETRPSTLLAYIDISMMAFGGMERTWGQWEELLRGVGLRVETVREIGAGGSGECVIECVRDAA